MVLGDDACRASRPQTGTVINRLQRDIDAWMKVRTIIRKHCMSAVFIRGL